MWNEKHSSAPLYQTAGWSQVKNFGGKRQNREEKGREESLANQSEEHFDHVIMTSTYPIDSGSSLSSCYLLLLLNSIFLHVCLCQSEMYMVCTRFPTLYNGCQGWCMISPNPLMSGLIILRVQFNVLVDGPQPNSGILIINLLDDITLLHGRAS